MRAYRIFAWPQLVALVGEEALRCLLECNKDSCLAAYRAVQAGARIDFIINMKVEGGERSRSHGLRSSVVKAQAESMSVQLEAMETSWYDYEKNMVSLLTRLAAEGTEAVIFGDIDLQAHLQWEEMVCHRTGLIPVLPVWQGG